MWEGGGISLLRYIYSYLELGQGSDVLQQHVVSKCKSLIASNEWVLVKSFYESRKQFYLSLQRLSVHFAEQLKTVTFP